MEQSDLVLVVLTGVSVLIGLNCGFCTEVLGLVVYIFSGVLGYAFAPVFVPAFTSIPFEPARKIAAVLLGTFVAWLVLKLVTGSFIHAVKRSSLNALDKSLGGVFGLIRAAFIVLLITAFLIFYAPEKLENGKILSSSSIWVKKIPEFDFPQEVANASVGWKKRLLHFLQNNNVKTEDGEWSFLFLASAAAANRFADTMFQTGDDVTLSGDQKKILASVMFETQFTAWLNEKPLTQEELAKILQEKISELKRVETENENSGD